jgi:C4-dicarboxylate-binding protein DctP
MELFKSLVEQRTAGKVTVQVYHAGLLYQDKDVFPAIQSGSIEAGLVITSQIAGYDPIFSIFDQPFLVGSYKVAIESCSGKVGEVLNQHAEKIGVKILSWPQQGFIQIANTKHALKVPKDFEGLKLRSHSGDVVNTIQLLGGAAVVIPAGDTYTALSRGTVDGVTTSIASFQSRKWSEVAKYLMVNNITLVGYPLCVNKKFWDKLPKDIQVTISAAAVEAAAVATKENIESDEKILKQFMDKGGTITYITDENRDQFLEKVKPITEDFFKATGSEGKMLRDYIMSLPK